jgi:hypothetical protein
MAMRQIPLLAAAVVGVLACAGVARADEAARLDQFARRMFATASPGAKAHACFVRTYDAAHLAGHHGQTVSAMKMLVKAERLPEDGELSYSYELRINFRDRPGDYASTFLCGHARPSDVKREGIRIHCHDGCEGGGVEIALAPGSRAIIVKIEDVEVHPVDKPNEADGEFDFRGGARDRVFRLDRVDSENCKSLIDDQGEVAAAQPE